MTKPITDGLMYALDRTLNGPHPQDTVFTRDYLALREPWHVVKLRGEEVVKVYRLDQRDAPFPDDRRALAGANGGATDGTAE